MDEEEYRRPGNAIREWLETADVLEEAFKEPEVMRRRLNKLLYTAAETGLLDTYMSTTDAIIIFKLCLLAAGDSDISDMMM